MARSRIPATDSEQLRFYKGMYHLRELFQDRVKLTAKMDSLDREIAELCKSIKPFISWEKIGIELGMTAFQAQRYFEPLMGENPNEEKE